MAAFPGGVLGQKLVLSVGDDRCDPKEAVAVANKFVNEGVQMVAGHFCSGSSIPASAVYSEEGILMMSPASTNPKLTEQGFENVYRTCGRDDQRSEEHTSELQSLMRISYAVFCLKKKNNKQH